MPDNASKPAPISRSGSVKPGVWQPPSVEELQQMLPLYEVLSLLGRGGMGAVYQGVQKSLDRMVAIKILPPGLGDEDLDFSRRFKQEAKAMARLSHPGIVAVFDAGETPDGLLYFVMEFIDGTDVQQMLQSQGRLPQEHALAVTAHVCDALAYAHDHGIVHRDIKPSNIIVSSTGLVKVADFGLAKMAAENTEATRSSVALGTPDFVAPEALITGMTVDGRADVYAVGVMLYQMLTGNIPRGMFTMPSRMIQEIDPRFDEIIAKAMQADREQRFPTAGVLRAELDSILTTPMAKEAAEVAEETIDTTMKKRTWWPAIAALVVALGGSAAWLAANARGKAPAPAPETPRATKTEVRAPAPAPVAPPPPVVVARAAPPPEAPAPVLTTAPAAAPAVAAPEMDVFALAQPVVYTAGPWAKAAIDPKPPVVLEDDWFSTGGAAFGLYPAMAAGTNQGARARFKYSAGGTADVMVRRHQEADGTTRSYSFRIDEAGVLRLVQFTNSPSTGKRERKDLLDPQKKLAVQNGDEVVMELIAVGGRLTAKVNGQVYGTTEGADATPGRVGTYADKMKVSGFQMLELDGMAEASALALIATTQADSSGSAIAPAAAPTAKPSMVSSAPSNDPDVAQRLAEIEGKFKALFDHLAGSSYKAGVDQLKQQYLGALKREEAKAQQKGSLKEVVMLQTEAKNVTSGAAADAEVPEAIKPMHATYQTALARLAADRDRAAGPAYQAYAKALDQYTAELTKAGRIDAAKQVSAVRDALNTPAPEAPASPAKTEVAAAAAGPKLRADDAAKELAQWTVSVGGTVTIREGGKVFDVHRGQLPKARYEVIEVDTGESPAEKMKPFPWDILPSLKAVSALKITQQEEVTAAQLAMFKSLPLESLALVKCKMSDDLVPALSLPATLRSLRLQGCGLTAKSIPLIVDKLPNLEKLFFIEETGDDADDLASLAKLKKLKALGLGGQLSGGVQQAVGTLTGLTELQLQRKASLDAATFGKLINLQSLMIAYRENSVAAETRSMLSLLKGMPKLNKLFLTSAGLSDADLDAVAQAPGINSLYLNENDGLTDGCLAKAVAMKKLDRLFLEKTGVSDAGMKTLEKMRGLKELDLKGSKVTDAGAKQIQNRLPGCVVTR